MTTIVPLFSNPKNNSPQSVHGLHFSLPLLESEYFTFPFSTKNGLYNSGSEKQKIKLQKTPGNLLDKLRKLYIIMERSSLEIFSHPHRKFLSVFLSLNRYLRENRPNYSSLHRNLLLVSKFKCAIPIENKREFRSDGAWNVSFCAQFNLHTGLRSGQSDRTKESLASPGTFKRSPHFL